MVKEAPQPKHAKPITDRCPGLSEMTGREKTTSAETIGYWLRLVGGSQWNRTFSYRTGGRRKKRGKITPADRKRSGEEIIVFLLKLKPES